MIIPLWMDAFYNWHWQNIPYYSTKPAIHWGSNTPRVRHRYLVIICFDSCSTIHWYRALESVISKYGKEWSTFFFQLQIAFLIFLAWICPFSDFSFIRNEIHPNFKSIWPLIHSRSHWQAVNNLLQADKLDAE